MFVAIVWVENVKVLHALLHVEQQKRNILITSAHDMDNSTLTLPYNKPFIKGHSGLEKLMILSI